MIYVKSGAEALDGFYVKEYPQFGNKKHWCSDIFGPRYSYANAPGTQALMVDMEPGEVVRPHFHGTAQFQLFPAGSGVIGRRNDPIQSLMVQYKDHHTAYGPITAGPNGLTFISLRVFTGVSAPVYLEDPDYREKLRPSKRRNWISPRLELSTVSILRHREQPKWEPLWDPAAIDDEMCAQMLRLGACQSVPGPDPGRAGGYYVFVVNGSMIHAGQDLGLWSMAVVEPTEASFAINAGPKGLEALILEFPREYEYREP
jgi:hypothetical protein